MRIVLPVTKFRGEAHIDMSVALRWQMRISLETATGRSQPPELVNPPGSTGLPAQAERIMIDLKRGK